MLSQNDSFLHEKSKVLVHPRSIRVNSSNTCTHLRKMECLRDSPGIREEASALLITLDELANEAQELDMGY